MGVGRPVKYKNNSTLSKKIDEYFKWCDEKKQIIIAEKVNKVIYKPYTVSGLCLYLGICRDTLCEYEKNPKFSDTVRRAKNRIENWIEEHSLNGDLNPTISIFNLKNNFGWRDKQEIDMKADMNYKVIPCKLLEPEE